MLVVTLVVVVVLVRWMGAYEEVMNWIIFGDSGTTYDPSSAADGAAEAVTAAPAAAVPLQG